MHPPLRTPTADDAVLRANIHHLGIRAQEDARRLLNHYFASSTTDHWIRVYAREAVQLRDAKGEDQ